MTNSKEYLFTFNENDFMKALSGDIFMFYIKSILQKTDFEQIQDYFEMKGKEDFGCCGSNQHFPHSAEHGTAVLSDHSHWYRLLGTAHYTCFMSSSLNFGWKNGARFYKSNLYGDWHDIKG